MSSQEAISAIRGRAELARRLSGETRDPAAKAGLLEIALLLESDADRFSRGPDRDEVGDDNCRSEARPGPVSRSPGSASDFPSGGG